MLGSSADDFTASGQRGAHPGLPLNLNFRSFLEYHQVKIGLYVTLGHPLRSSSLAPLRSPPGTPTLSFLIRKMDIDEYT